MDITNKMLLLKVVQDFLSVGSKTIKIHNCCVLSHLKQFLCVCVCL